MKRPYLTAQTELKPRVVDAANCLAVITELLSDKKVRYTVLKTGVYLVYYK